jgi:hypothetical protein
MRVDKDQLIKHHFWILLGIFLILWLVSVALIKTSAADIGVKAKADFTTALTGIQAAGGKSPKNENFNKPWVAYGKTYEGQKNNVWKDAWEVQKDMFDWPWNGDAPLNRLQYPDDEVTYPERLSYQTDLWKTQFQKLQGEIAPLVIRGGAAGFVRIMMPGFSSGGGGTPAAAAAPVAARGATGLLSMGQNQGAAAQVVQTAPAQTVADSGPFDNFWARVPTVEEMWLAQEDFWTKRELLRIVREAVASVARFQEVAEDKDKDKPEGIAGRHHFKNTLWEIDLMLEKQGRNQWLISGRSTIKNVHPAGRTVPLSASPSSGGLHFSVKQGNKRVPFRVDGEPLPVGATAAFRKSWKIDTINFEKPFELEQDFEPANCPVRELLDLELGKHSHRTNSPLLTSITIKPAKQEAAAAASAAPAAAAPASGKAAPAPAAGAGAGEGDFTPNHLARRRYVFRTEQVRHIPIALHMVVDIAHMHDVLIAMSNSRLRVQTTQVQFRHINGFHPEDSESSGNSHYVGPDEDPYLVELAVYGIASLYERYPPKGKPDATVPATAPAPGTAPAAGPAAAAPGKQAAPPTTAAAGKSDAPGKAAPPTTAKSGANAATAAAGQPPATAPAQPAGTGKAPDAKPVPPTPANAAKGNAPPPAAVPVPAKGTPPTAKAAEPKKS